VAEFVALAAQMLEMGFVVLVPICCFLSLAIEKLNHMKSGTARQLAAHLLHSWYESLNACAESHLLSQPGYSQLYQPKLFFPGKCSVAIQQPLS